MLPPVLFCKVTCKIKRVIGFMCDSIHFLQWFWEVFILKLLSPILLLPPTDTPKCYVQTVLKIKQF